MARVLVIEDDADIRDVLDYNLRQAGHEVLLASTGEDGLRTARERRPDLVLLDRMLPDVAGLDVCRALKRTPETRSVPIMIVSAKGEEIDRVAGLESGADDYVTKPFSVRELVLRVVAVLRRGDPEPIAASELRFGTLRVDRDAHRAWIEEREITLTAIELRLLVTLYVARNRVMSRSALRAAAWGGGTGDADAGDDGARTVDTHVKRLRDKLGRAADYIETVRGVGYRFKSEP